MRPVRDRWPPVPHATPFLPLTPADLFLPISYFPRRVTAGGFSDEPIAEVIVCHMFPSYS